LPNPTQPTDSSNVTETGPVSAGQSFGVDHSFTLQAIMELQKSTGQLTSCVESLKENIDKQDKKLDNIEGTLSAITHKIYAATAILAILVVIGGFIVNKSWDLMINQLGSSATVQTQQGSTKKP